MKRFLKIKKLSIMVKNVAARLKQMQAADEKHDSNK